MKLVSQIEDAASSKTNICHKYVSETNICHKYVSETNICHKYVCETNICHKYVCETNICHKYVFLSYTYWDSWQVCQSSVCQTLFYHLQSTHIILFLTSDPVLLYRTTDPAVQRVGSHNNHNIYQCFQRTSSLFFIEAVWPNSTITLLPWPQILWSFGKKVWNTRFQNLMHQSMIQINKSSSSSSAPVQEFVLICGITFLNHCHQDVVTSTSYGGSCFSLCIQKRLYFAK